jgi:hypothetical protein
MAPLECFPCPDRHSETKLAKLKIMDKDMGLALYRDLYQSLTITISRDRFNVKKHHALYLNFSKGLR